MHQNLSQNFVLLLTTRHTDNDRVTCMVLKQMYQVLYISQTTYKAQMNQTNQTTQSGLELETQTHCTDAQI